MEIFSLTLEIYFALLLGVSGIAKIDTLRSFEVTLHQQGILPRWSIAPFSRIFPYVEITLAFLIITGTNTFISGLSILVLFFMFLIVKLFLFFTHYDKDCGCYGKSNLQPIDRVSLAVAVIFVCLAMCHLWLIMQFPTIGGAVRFFCSVVFVGMGGFLFSKIMLKQRNLSSNISSLSFDVGGLEVGEKAPMFDAIDQHKNRLSLEDFSGKQRLLAFVSPGCHACPGALKSLEQFLQNEQQLVGLAIGSSSYERNLAYIDEQGINIPLLTPDPRLTDEIYQVRGFPLIFVLDEVGIIRAKGVVNKIEHLKDLLVAASVSLSANS